MHPQVFSTSSNLVRVEVLPTPEGEGAALEQQQQHLLCSMRSLLRKLGHAVLVGDYVRVGAVDWAQAKGQVRAALVLRGWVGGTGWYWDTPGPAAPPPPTFNVRWPLHHRLPPATHSSSQVEEVLLPRRSQLADPSVANVDLALLVFALTTPPVRVLRAGKPPTAFV